MNCATSIDDLTLYYSAVVDVKLNFNYNNYQIIKLQICHKINARPSRRFLKHNI